MGAPLPRWDPPSGNPPQRKAGQEMGVAGLGGLHPCNGGRMGVLQFGVWGAGLYPRGVEGPGDTHGCSTCTPMV